MSKFKPLSNAQLREKIKEGSDFDVKTNDERKRALLVAGILGADIFTRATANGKGFRIYIPSEVTN